MTHATSSFGHALRLLAEAEWWHEPFGYRVSRQRVSCARGLRCPGVAVVTTDWRAGEAPGPTHEWTSADKRGAAAIYESSYHYVTGKRGRVGKRREVLCSACAGLFSQRHMTEATDAGPSTSPLAEPASSVVQP